MLRICLACLLDAELLDRPRSFDEVKECDFCKKECAYVTNIGGYEWDYERRVLMRFARKMAEKVQVRNVRYKPFGWREREIDFLINWLHQEVAELLENMDKEECIDIANLVFMIHDKLTLEGK